jgi:hypothetical protein
MSIPVIEQAKIQARVLVPLAKALQTELGEERATAIVPKALGDMYRKLSEKWWRAQGGSNLSDIVASAFERYAAGGALDYEVVKQSGRLRDERHRMPLGAVLQGTGRTRAGVPVGLRRGLSGGGRLRCGHKAHAHADHHARGQSLRLSIPADHLRMDLMRPNISVRCGCRSRPCRWSSVAAWIAMEVMSRWYERRRALPISAAAPQTVGAGT